MAAGIVCEDIIPAEVIQNDKSDGCKTIAIYKVEDGFTPRVEIRFTINRPQVWWISSEHSDYITSPYSSNFPGDFRSWSLAEFVCYLIDLAKSKLLKDTEAKVLLIKANTVEAAPSMDEGEIKEVFKLINDPNSDITDLNSLTKHLREQGNSVDKFKFDVFHWFEKGKLTLKDIDMLEDQYPPGKPIFPFRFIKHQLSDPKYNGKLSPTWLERVSGSVNSSALAVRKKLDHVLANAAARKPLKRGLALNLVFAEDVAYHITAGTLPVTYLDLFTKADPTEQVAPWSWIRRSVYAFHLPKPSSDCVSDAVLAWLERSKLIAALYEMDASDEMKDVLRHHVDTFSERTVANPSWVCATLDSIATASTPTDVTKGLQAEFDVWMLGALGSCNGTLPLSPAAYTTSTDLYQKVFASWLGKLKGTVNARRPQSLKSLSQALGGFYENLAKAWHTDLLEGFKPKVPSSEEIAAACKTGTDPLFMLLIADVEDEIGLKFPEDKKTELLASPYFNTIFREVRFQGVRL